MLRSEYKRYKDKLRSLIPNTSEINLDKEALRMFRYSVECNLNVAVKPLYSQASWHEIVTNKKRMEQV